MALASLLVLGCSASSGGPEEPVASEHDDLSTLVPIGPPPTFPPLRPLYPYITSISPTSGGPGTVVTITGGRFSQKTFGFGPYESVRFAGALIPYTVVSASEITVVVPPTCGTHPFELVHQAMAPAPEIGIQTYLDSTSVPFNCTFPPVTMTVVNQSRYEMTSFKIDGVEQIQQGYVLLNGNSWPISVPVGPHTLAAKLGANDYAQAQLFAWSDNVTAVGLQPFTVTLTPLRLTDVLTNFQASRRWHLAPFDPTNPTYLTINSNGSWTCTGALVGSGSSLTPTNWPANALSIDFMLSDGTTATFDVLSGEINADHQYLFETP
jgi:hypothetical protein